MNKFLFLIIILSTIISTLFLLDIQKAKKVSSMSHLWMQTIIINSDLAKQLIEEQTSLKVTSIENFGEGWDNIAYLVNKEYIFRFPRREMGVDCIKNEISILPYIKTKVSFPFSYPQYIGKETEKYRSPFAGYKMLEGIPLCDTNAELVNDVSFAKNLALWLKELHLVPALKNHIHELKGDQSWRYDNQGKLEKSKSRILQYEQYFIDSGLNKNDLFEAIKKLSKLNKYDHIETTSYIHGDLYSRHLLVDKNKNLSGIIDWGDIHIGNPGSDLSIGYMILSDKALKTFFDNYGVVTDEMKYIGIVRALCHSITLLPYCYEKKEENLKGWTILALKRAIDIIKSLK